MPLPLEDYGLIGDLETAALVGCDRSIDWLCVPRFDSSACLAALLGDERHGRWFAAAGAAGAQGGAPSCATRRRASDDGLPAGEGAFLPSPWSTPPTT
jgi:GH15 family glucan-1,4-alpha-glucosidase